MYRFLPLAASLLMFALFAACVPVSPFFWIGVLMFGGLSALGLYDVLQREHTLWRNYPIAGRIRWIAEELRPFLRAYIVEGDTEGRPFSIEERAMVYRRAKDVSSVEPLSYTWTVQEGSDAWKPVTTPPMM